MAPSSFAQTSGGTPPLTPNHENSDPTQEDVRDKLILLCRRQAVLVENARDMDERFENAQTRLYEDVNRGLNTLRLGTIKDLDSVRSELLGTIDHLRLSIEGKLSELVQARNLQSQRSDWKAETNAQGIHEVQLQMRNLESCLNELQEASNRSVLESHRRAFSPDVAAGPEVIQVTPHNPWQQPPPPNSEPRPPPPHRLARVDCHLCGINYSRSYLSTHLKKTCKGPAVARS